MPCTTTQKTSTGMIILMSLMKLSPSGLSLLREIRHEEAEGGADQQCEHHLAEEGTQEPGHGHLRG